MKGRKKNSVLTESRLSWCVWDLTSASSESLSSRVVWSCAFWDWRSENSAERERNFWSRREQVCSAVIEAASAWALTVSSSLYRPWMKASAFSAIKAASLECRENSSSEMNKWAILSVMGYKMPGADQLRANKARRVRSGGAETRRWFSAKEKGGREKETGEAEKCERGVRFGERNPR